MKRPDYLAKHVKPMKLKNLKKELSRTIRQQFPRVGGPRMTDLCADLVLEVVHKHLLPREHLRHGQLVWLAFDVDDPPSRAKTMADVRLVPVVLDASTDEDLDAVLARVPAVERLARRCARLLEQTRVQGGLLSNVDLATMLGCSESQISRAIAIHEERTGTILPRRATVHDVGTAVTHKVLICWKRYAEGKSPDQIARETHHSLDAVDRYLGMFERVRFCRQQSMELHEIAQVLACSPGLVEQYLAIDQRLSEEQHA